MKTWPKWLVFLAGVTFGIVIWEATIVQMWHRTVAKINERSAGSTVIYDVEPFPNGENMDWHRLRLGDVLTRGLTRGAGDPPAVVPKFYIPANVPVITYGDTRTTRVVYFDVHGKVVSVEPAFTLEDIQKFAALQKEWK